MRRSRGCRCNDGNDSSLLFVLCALGDVPSSSWMYVCAGGSCMQIHDLVVNLLFNAIAEGMWVQKHVGESKFCTSRYSMKPHYCLPLMIRLLVELPGHSTPTSLE